MKTGFIPLKFVWVCCIWTIFLFDPGQRSASLGRIVLVATSTSMEIISKAPAGHHTDKDLVVESSRISYVS